MAAKGKIGPMPDCAIFADTGWEPQPVYEHLARLTKALPFPVHVVSAGNIRDHILRSATVTGGRSASVPWFTANGGMGPRQCTREFKVEPIEKKQRELLGYAPRKRIPAKSSEVWIGISTDEAIRMKPARNAWQVNRWPLIERRISRRDCIAWLAEQGWSAPKSSCIGCPYHSDAQWRELRDDNPDGWADAVTVDEALRKGGTARGMRHHQFMHRSLVPLSQADLRTHEELGQPDLFLNECEGMCGV
jgi:hypothetical protein